MEPLLLTMELALGLLAAAMLAGLKIPQKAAVAERDEMTRLVRGRARNSGR